jgi:DNA-binding response OmpR family regulator
LAQGVANNFGPTPPKVENYHGPRHTQEMISDQVWGGEINIFTNIIPVYVNYLRKKLRKVDNKELIHTVRGVGYLLKEAV